MKKGGNGSFVIHASGFESLSADSSCQQLSAVLGVAVSACCVRLIHHLYESVSGHSNEALISSLNVAAASQIFTRALSLQSPKINGVSPETKEQFFHGAFLTF